MKTKKTAILAAVAAAVLGSTASSFATGTPAEAVTLLNFIYGDPIAGEPSSKIKGALGKAIDGKPAKNDTWGTQAGVGTEWDAANLDATEVQYLVEAAIAASTDGNNDLLVAAALSADEKRVKIEPTPLARTLGDAADVANVQAIIQAAIDDPINDLDDDANDDGRLALLAKTAGKKKAFAAVIGQEIFTEYSFAAVTATEIASIKATITNLIKADKANMAGIINAVAAGAAGDEDALGDWINLFTEGAVLGNKGKVGEISALLVEATGASLADRNAIIAKADSLTGAKKTNAINASAQVAYTVNQAAASTSNTFDAVKNYIDAVGPDGKKIASDAVVGGVIADPDRAPWAVRGGIQGAYDSQIDDKKGTSAASSIVAKATGRAIQYAGLASRSAVGSSEATDRTDAQGADDAAANIVTAAIHELRINPALDGDGTVDAGKGKSGAAKVLGKIVAEAVKVIVKLDGDPYTAKLQRIGGAAAGATVGAVAQVVDSGDTFVQAVPVNTGTDFNTAMLYNVMLNVGKRLKKDATTAAEVIDAAAMAAVWILNGPGALVAGTAGEADTLADEIRDALIEGADTTDATYLATVNAALASVKGRWADNSLDPGDVSWGAYGVAALATPGTPYSFSFSTSGYPVTDISGF